MKLSRIAIYAVAPLVAVLGWLIVYNSQPSIAVEPQVTFLSLNVDSPYSSKVVKGLLVPGVSSQDPEWFVKAQSDPNSQIHLNTMKAGPEIARRISTR